MIWYMTYKSPPWCALHGTGGFHCVKTLKISSGDVYESRLRNVLGRQSTIRHRYLSSAGVELYSVLVLFLCFSWYSYKSLPGYQSGTVRFWLQNCSKEFCQCHVIFHQKCYKTMYIFEKSNEPFLRYGTPDTLFLDKINFFS